MTDLDESALIKRDVEEFLSKNKSKYEIMDSFQYQLNHLNKDSYTQTVDFIEKNKELFFKDHQSTTFFIYSFLDSSINNFKNFELILDIPIHFSEEMKRNVTDSEIIGMCMIFLNSINYFFSKGFFSITSIISKSMQYSYIFINFLPEIEEYDKEFAQIKKQQIPEILNTDENENINDFYQTVISDYSKHILNRNLNYHPSPLHKAIRDDDIDTFQSLISQNNFKLNEPIKHSYYERAKTIDSDLQPIKIAALYGSLKVFKFLMMNNASLIGNLLCYAYFGANFEIIHLIEDKCSHEEVYIQPIITHNKELIEYFIENFGDEIVETDEEVKNIVCNCDENSYKILNSQCLHGAAVSNNYPIITSCLERIVTISRNVEIKEETGNSRESYFLFDCEYDFELFKFLYSHIKPNVKKYKCQSITSYLLSSGEVNSFDVLKFLFNEFKDGINCRLFVMNSIYQNQNIVNFILDFLINDKETNNLQTYFNISKRQFRFKDLLNAINNYNEDIVVKMIQLFDLIKNSSDIINFVTILSQNISSKMICSLYKRIFMFLPKKTWIEIASHYDDLSEIKHFLMEELKHRNE